MEKVHKVTISIRGLGDEGLKYLKDFIGVIDDIKDSTDAMEISCTEIEEE